MDPSSVPINNLLPQVSTLGSESTFVSASILSGIVFNLISDILWKLYEVCISY